MKSARTTHILIVTILLPLTMSAPAFSAGEIRLSGTAALNSDYCTKGTSNPNCTIDFSVTGKVAKVIYDGKELTVDLVFRSIIQDFDLEV